MFEIKKFLFENMNMENSTLARKIHTRKNSFLYFKTALFGKNNLKFNVGKIYKKYNFDFATFTMIF